MSQPTIYPILPSYRSLLPNPECSYPTVTRPPPYRTQNVLGAAGGGRPSSSGHRDERRRLGRDRQRVQRACESLYKILKNKES